MRCSTYISYYSHNFILNCKMTYEHVIIMTFVENGYVLRNDVTIHHNHTIYHWNPNVPIIIRITRCTVHYRIHIIVWRKGGTVPISLLINTLWSTPWIRELPTRELVAKTPCDWDDWIWNMAIPEHYSVVANRSRGWWKKSSFKS